MLLVQENHCSFKRRNTSLISKYYNDLLTEQEKEIINKLPLNDDNISKVMLIKKLFNGKFVEVI